jgi:hypothetical protein
MRASVTRTLNVLYKFKFKFFINKKKLHKEHACMKEYIYIVHDYTKCSFLTHKTKQINVYNALSLQYHFTNDEVWVHESSLIPPLFIEVSVPSLKSERSCVC